jgi:hypothetical protein
MISRLRSLKPHLLMLTALFALAACTQGTKLQPTQSGGAEGKSGIEKNFSLLTDIPIPPDSTLNVERSLILGDLDRWTGRIVLNVGRGATPTFAIYQTQMPNFGWAPIMSVQAEISVLSFTRGERAATVQIEGRTLGGSIATITVAPRQSGATPDAGSGANAPVQVTPAR